jgi:hypothetical protein
LTGLPSTSTNCSLFQKAMLRVIQSRRVPDSRSELMPTPTSVGCASYTVRAADSGVPRFHSLAMRA